MICYLPHIACRDSLSLFHALHDPNANFPRTSKQHVTLKNLYQFCFD